MARWIGKQWLRETIIDNDLFVSLSRPRRAQISQISIASSPFAKFGASCFLNDGHHYIPAVFTYGSLEEFERRHPEKPLTSLKRLAIVISKYTISAFLDPYNVDFDLQLIVEEFDWPGGYIGFSMCQETEDVLECKQVLKKLEEFWKDHAEKLRSIANAESTYTDFAKEIQESCPIQTTKSAMGISLRSQVDDGSLGKRADASIGKIISLAKSERKGKPMNESSVKDSRRVCSSSKTIEDRPQPNADISFSKTVVRAEADSQSGSIDNGNGTLLAVRNTLDSQEASTSVALLKGKHKLDEKGVSLHMSKKRRIEECSKLSFDEEERPQQYITNASNEIEKHCEEPSQGFTVGDFHIDILHPRTSTYQQELHSLNSRQSVGSTHQLQMEKESAVTDEKDACTPQTNCQEASTSVALLKGKHKLDEKGVSLHMSKKRRIEECSKLSFDEEERPQLPMEKESAVLDEKDACSPHTKRDDITSQDSARKQSKNHRQEFIDEMLRKGADNAILYSATSSSSCEVAMGADTCVNEVNSNAKNIENTSQTIEKISPYNTEKLVILKSDRRLQCVSNVGKHEISEHDGHNKDAISEQPDSRMVYATSNSGMLKVNTPEPIEKNTVGQNGPNHVKDETHQHANDSFNRQNDFQAKTAQTSLQELMKSSNDEKKNIDGFAQPTNEINSQVDQEKELQTNIAGTHTIDYAIPPPVVSQSISTVSQLIECMACSPEKSLPEKESDSQGISTIAQLIDCMAYSPKKTIIEKRQTDINLLPASLTEGLADAESNTILAPKRDSTKKEEITSSQSGSVHTTLKEAESQPENTSIEVGSSETTSNSQLSQFAAFLQFSEGGASQQLITSEYSQQRASCIQMSCHTQEHENMPMPEPQSDMSLYNEDASSNTQLVNSSVQNICSQTGIIYDTVNIALSKPKTLQIESELLEKTGNSQLSQLVQFLEFSDGGASQQSIASDLSLKNVSNSLPLKNCIEKQTDSQPVALPDHTQEDENVPKFQSNVSQCNEDASSNSQLVKSSVQNVCSQTGIIYDTVDKAASKPKTLQIESEPLEKTGNSQLSQLVQFLEFSDGGASQQSIASDLSLENVSNSLPLKKCIEKQTDSQPVALPDHMQEDENVPKCQSDKTQFDEHISSNYQLFETSVQMACSQTNSLCKTPREEVSKSGISRIEADPLEKTDNSQLSQLAQFLEFSDKRSSQQFIVSEVCSNNAVNSQSTQKCFGKETNRQSNVLLTDTPEYDSMSNSSSNLSQYSQSSISQLAECLIDSSTSDVSENTVLDDTGEEKLNSTCKDVQSRNNKIITIIQDLPCRPENNMSCPMAKQGQMTQMGQMVKKGKEAGHAMSSCSGTALKIGQTESCKFDRKLGGGSSLIQEGNLEIKTQHYVQSDSVRITNQPVPHGSTYSPEYKIKAKNISILQTDRIEMHSQEDTEMDPRPSVSKDRFTLNGSMDDIMKCTYGCGGDVDVRCCVCRVGLDKNKDQRTSWSMTSIDASDVDGISDVIKNITCSDNTGIKESVDTGTQDSQSLLKGPAHYFHKNHTDFRFLDSSNGKSESSEAYSSGDLLKRTSSRSLDHSNSNDDAKEIQVVNHDAARETASLGYESDETVYFSAEESVFGDLVNTRMSDTQGKQKNIRNKRKRGNNSVSSNKETNSDDGQACAAFPGRCSLKLSLDTLPKTSNLYSKRIPVGATGNGLSKATLHSSKGALVSSKGISKGKDLAAMEENSSHAKSKDVEEIWPSKRMKRSLLSYWTHRRAARPPPNISIFSLYHPKRR